MPNLHRTFFLFSKRGLRASRGNPVFVSTGACGESQLRAANAVRPGVWTFGDDLFVPTFAEIFVAICRQRFFIDGQAFPIYEQPKKKPSEPTEQPSDPPLGLDCCLPRMTSRA
jgi:hypothetical protein